MDKNPKLSQIFIERGDDYTQWVGQLYDPIHHAYCAVGILLKELGLHPESMGNAYFMAARMAINAHMEKQGGFPPGWNAHVLVHRLVAWNDLDGLNFKAIGEKLKREGL